MKSSKHLGLKLGLATVTLASLIAASGTSASAVDYIEVPAMVENVEEDFVITPRFRAYFRVSGASGITFFNTLNGGAIGTLGLGSTFAIVNPTSQHGRIQIVHNGQNRWIYQSALRFATWTGGDAF